MIEILAAAAVFGFSLGFSQEMAKDLRRMARLHRRTSRMGPPSGNYGLPPDPDWRRSRPRPSAPGPWDPQAIYLDAPSTTTHHTLNRDTHT